MFADPTAPGRYDLIPRSARRATAVLAGRGAHGWRCVLTVVALLVVCSAGQARQTPAESATPDWIRPEEVPARSDVLLRRLEDAKPTPQSELVLKTIEQQLPRLSRDLDSTFDRATAAIQRSASPRELEDIRREIESIAEPLGGWKSVLSEETQRVVSALDEIAHAERTWAATRARPETAAAGEVVMRRVDSSISALEDAAARLRPWRDRVLAANDAVIGSATAADVALEKLRAASVAERAGLFVPDRPPIWARGFGAEIREELPRAMGEILSYTEGAVAYIKRDPRPLLVQISIGALLLFGLGRFSSRALKRLSADEAALRATRLLERPYSIALLLTLIASPIFHPLAPRRFIQIVVVMALFPAARILIHRSERVSPQVFAVVFVLLFFDRLGLALQPLPALERATFIFMLLFALGMTIWLSRRAEIDDYTQWLRRAAKPAMLGLALALLAEIGGWTYLASLLGRGIIASSVAGLYVYAAVIAVGALVAYALASPTCRRSRLLGRNTALMQKRAESLLRWVAVAVWLYFVAMAVGLHSVGEETLAALLNAGVSVGALSLSIGGVLAFVLTLLMALLLARIVTAILEEDVYPRAHLPRGMPYALSTLVRYGFYSLGFLFALGAAGVQLGQVAIMLGGLGIGIGLGLQDLVKNFAAGLTLLFERRVQVGDAVEMPSQGIFGRVVSIGMRASVVRSWNGAEVVVPNADLIANAVTNWTLSDRLCRIEVPVGVAYGTDPERAMALLLDAARSNERLLAQPAPDVLFKGFGESSLDFVVRAWTDRGYDMALGLTSELGLAVHRNLSEAGISIPFPQRDFHLTSVAPAVKAALSDGGRKE